MSRVPAKKAILAFTILIAAGAFIYFPDAWLPLVLGRKDVVRYQDNDQFFPEIFTFASSHCSPCKSDSKSVTCSDGDCCPTNPPSVTNTCKNDCGKSGCSDCGASLSTPSCPENKDDSQCPDFFLACPLNSDCNCESGDIVCVVPPDRSCTNSCLTGCACEDCGPLQPPCDRQNQGLDLDSDGFPKLPSGGGWIGGADTTCLDCFDDTSCSGGVCPGDVNPGETNLLCDCDPGTGYSVSTNIDPSGNIYDEDGHSELTNCDVISGQLHLDTNCRCLDLVDNDCDGFIDMDDPDCNDIQNQDLVINGEEIILTQHTTVDGAVIIMSCGVLRLAGFNLNIRKGDSDGLNGSGDGINDGLHVMSNCDELRLEGGSVVWW